MQNSNLGPCQRLAACSNSMQIAYFQLSMSICTEFKPAAKSSDLTSKANLAIISEESKDEVMNGSKEEEESPNHEDTLPDRPLECSECKKPIYVLYTEILGDAITRTCMCVDCPELHRRLHGTPARRAGTLEEAAAGLACGNCGTTLESLRVGIPLGCSDCYTVFDDVLIGEMLASEKLPPRLATPKKGAPIHIGRAPGEIQEMTPSLRLLALNEALNETLKKEDYEQAALLRDQIKALTEHPEKRPKKKNNHEK